jgi:hypothetical protein
MMTTGLRCFFHKDLYALALRPDRFPTRCIHQYYVVGVLTNVRYVRTPDLDQT